MSKKLHTRTARAALEKRAKPYFVTLFPGVSLGYRRNEGVGSWTVRVADGKGGNWIQKIGFADDQADANNDTVLSYDQAAAKASAITGIRMRAGLLELEPAPAANVVKLRG
jgi:hypothetical protein